MELEQEEYILDIRYNYEEIFLYIDYHPSTHYDFNTYL